MKRPKLITHEEVERGVDEALAEKSEHHGLMQRLVQLWRRVFPVVLWGPCIYCGKDASDRGRFSPGVFYHDSCSERQWEKDKADKKRREQIDLIKTAIRELEAEKLNTEASHGDDKP